MSQDQNHGTPRLRGRIALSLLVWVVLFLLGAAAISPFLNRAGWIIDLVGGLSANFLAATLVFGVLVALRGHMIEIVILVLIIMAHVWAQSSPRAPRAVQGSDTGLRVCVMQYNAYTLNDSPDLAMQELFASNADLIALTEPSDGLLELIRASGEVRRRWPYFRLPERARGGFRLILSRWPFERVDLGISLPDPPKVARIQHPDQSFYFIQAHPASPRTARAWHVGNLVTEQLASAEVLGGLPVIIAADLNGTATSLRAEIMRSRGLRQAKPRWRLASTYPSRSAFPFAVQIDDIWLSDDWRVISWRTGKAAGSDHSPVVVELVLPTETVSGDDSGEGAGAGGT